MRIPRHDLADETTVGPGSGELSLVHLSDAHIVDAASPARCEWVELRGDDPRWRPLLHMHRPYEALAVHALAAHVEQIRTHPIGPTTARPHDLVLSTGDCIDNAQVNELRAYLTLMGGGRTSLDQRGCALDPPSGTAESWPFWDPAGRYDSRWSSWFPLVEDLVARASEPVHSPGLGLAWTSVVGNHDLLRQGTALTTDELESIAVGAHKAWAPQPDFSPCDPLAQYIDAPHTFSDGPGQAVAADPDRRAIDRQLWAAAHLQAGAIGISSPASSGDSLDAVLDIDAVRIITLDTTHPQGDFQGSASSSQLEWLDAMLTEVDKDRDRFTIIASHHGPDSLVNRRGDDPQRRHRGDLLTVAHRHPSLIAWLVGHRHIHRIEPHAGPHGGFWEITTGSIIDWPSQTRSIEVLRHARGLVELRTTVNDHGDNAELAALHRRLAASFAEHSGETHRRGRDLDADTQLFVDTRR